MAHHGDDVCEGVVSVLDVIPSSFLPLKTYGAGVFCSRPNPSTNLFHKDLWFYCFFFGLRAVLILSQRPQYIKNAY
jgi:hypothetical protein